MYKKTPSEIDKIRLKLIHLHLIYNSLIYKELILNTSLLTDTDNEMHHC